MREFLCFISTTNLINSGSGPLGPGFLGLFARVKQAIFSVYQCSVKFQDGDWLHNDGQFIKSILGNDLSQDGK